MGIVDLLTKNPDSIFARAYRHWEDTNKLPSDLDSGVLREMQDGMPLDAPPEFKQLVNADCSTT